MHSKHPYFTEPHTYCVVCKMSRNQAEDDNEYACMQCGYDPDDDHCLAYARALYKLPYPEVAPDGPSFGGPLGTPFSVDQDYPCQCCKIFTTDDH